MHPGKWTDSETLDEPSKSISPKKNMQTVAQVKDVYRRKNGALLPDYIKGLSNPNRAKYYDSLVALKPEVTC